MPLEMHFLLLMTAAGDGCWWIFDTKSAWLPQCHLTRPTAAISLMAFGAVISPYQAQPATSCCAPTMALATPALATPSTWRPPGGCWIILAGAPLHRRKRRVRHLRSP